MSIKEMDKKLLALTLSHQTIVSKTFFQKQIK
jgi:hypothetical protein